jgi:hypothetical protein
MTNKTAAEAKPKSVLANDRVAGYLISTMEPLARPAALT